MSSTSVSKPKSPLKKLPPISFIEAIIYWIKLGFISFGGPAGQISMMHQELVEKRHWISEKRFLHALNYTMVLPGPEAQQLATYIGWLMHGVKGGIVAGVFFVLPSLFILCGLAWAYLAWGNISMVAGVLYGIKPAVTVIVLFAAFRIGKKALPNHPLKAMAVLSFVAIFALEISFPLIVLAASFLGFLGSKFAPGWFETSAHSDASDRSYEAAIIDDDTCQMVHTWFRLSRVFATLAVGLVLSVSVFVLLVTQFGINGTFSQMAWFFTKAAMVTFGGAYAVLPYVYQGGVEQYQWLSATQMIDGLALGETTPGPLIMVVAYVGFVGGWVKEVFGADFLPLAGFIGASVATFFTFLPSFLFILVGAPLVEKTRHDIKFTAPLISITAAVVGVIINLAVFFAYHTFWPSGLNGSFEWPALLIGILAFAAMFYFGVNLVWVILASGVLGALLFGITL